ncbi:restriction endonuclease subunit S [Prevotella sp.]|uniref:restriction endonuclease subunit S n=1 Tax=Prevotella sp. TaxID=59823 RepID=UPI002649F716|nr:restriction endonuclease subunit S [Prevotella sp.]MDN5554168.1 restriction endonuclease subunit S [Prevotella sp.]
MKCIDDEIPFEIPSGWRLCRLKDLALYRKGPFGSSLTKSMFVPKCDNSVKVYEQKNAIQKDFTLGNYYVSQNKFHNMQSFIVTPGDLIVSCAGTIGETYCLPDEAPIGIINQALMRVQLFDKQLTAYWQLYFKYILINESEMKGSGSAIKNIPPFEYLKSIIVVLPPLAEQNRIVKILQQLNELIENYDKMQAELNTFNTNIFDKIRKSIIQEAIQGRLVPQDPNDKSASVLLERIRAEKERLIKEKKIKRDKNESVIFKGDDNLYYEKLADGIEICIDDEIPFELPESWSWCRLGSICQLIIGKTPPRGDSSLWGDGIYSWVSISDMTEYGYILSTKEKISQKAAENSFGERISKKESLLMSFKLTIGRTSILKIDAFHNEAIITVKPYLDDNFSLRNYLFRTLPILSNIGESKDAIKGKTLNSKSLSNLLIPISSHAELFRICQMIDRIFETL